jgi:predicted O-methyltransferase YrrM
MPEDEGLALYRAGLRAPFGPFLEIGSYCGKSAVYLGAAAREQSTVVYSIDHHRGSEEHQVGQQYHDASVTDSATGLVDTLPTFRRTIAEASLSDVVLGMVVRSEILAREWRTPLGLVFIDGGHSEEDARADYEGWAPHIEREGALVIHDVFSHPAQGDRRPSTSISAPSPREPSRVGVARESASP